jgi:hypothetical protein
MASDESIASTLIAAVEWTFVRDTTIAGKMYEWWQHDDGTLVLRPSALRDPEFVERLRQIVDDTAFDRIALREFR